MLPRGTVKLRFRSTTCSSNANETLSKTTACSSELDGGREGEADGVALGTGMSGTYHPLPPRSRSTQEPRAGGGRGPEHRLRASALEVLELGLFDELGHFASIDELDA